MLYLIALFLHATGALLLAAATGIEWLCIINLRNAGTVENVRLSLSNYTRLSIIGGIAMGLILVPGIYMMVAEWMHYSAWIAAAFLGIIIMAVIGGAVSSRRMRSAGKLLAAQNTVTPELRKTLGAQSLLFSIKLRTAIFLGIILLMVAKPLPATSFIILAVSIVVGSIPIKRRAYQSIAAQTEHKPG